MLNKTRAIVLHKTNYSESSIVVQAYSLDYGKISFLIQGVKRKKSRNKSALFEPLSILEFVGNFSDTEKLIRPREVKLYIPFVNIQSNISKRFIALFLSEILHKSIKEPHPEHSMYMFIEKSLRFLEETEQNIANFHISFLLELTAYLGFRPRISEGEYFNMLEGSFSNNIPESNMYLQGSKKELFLQALGTKIDSSDLLRYTSEQRKDVLSFIIQYYQVHIAGFGEVKSHQILETIFK